MRIRAVQKVWIMCVCNVCRCVSCVCMYGAHMRIVCICVLCAYRMRIVYIRYAYDMHVVCIFRRFHTPQQGLQAQLSGMICLLALK